MNAAVTMGNGFCLVVTPQDTDWIKCFFIISIKMSPGLIPSPFFSRQNFLNFHFLHEFSVELRDVFVCLSPWICCPSTNPIFLTHWMMSC